MPASFGTTGQAHFDALGALGILPELPTLQDTYGALLLGSFAGVLLYGVLVNQSYRYFQMYTNDRLANKVVVYSLLGVDTVHSLVCVHSCYWYLVTSYSNPLALLRGIWSIQIQTVLAGLAILISQSFFARRVYLISKKHRILVATSASILLTFATFGFAITGAVIAFRLHTFLEYRHFYWIDAAACATATAADALTTSVLIVTLKRSQTGFKQTDTILNGLVVYAINTGLLTGITNCLALVFALARPNTFIWIALEIVAIKLYANSVLAVLNSRRSLRTTGTSEILELPMTVGGTSSATPPIFNHSQKSSSIPTCDSATIVHMESSTDRHTMS